MENNATSVAAEQILAVATLSLLVTFNQSNALHLRNNFTSSTLMPMTLSAENWSNSVIKAPRVLLEKNYFICPWF